MKKTYQFLIMLFLTGIATFNAKGGNYPYFFDSPRNDYYANSWLGATAASTLECASTSLLNFTIENIITLF